SSANVAGSTTRRSLRWMSPRPSNGSRYSSVSGSQRMAFTRKSRRRAASSTDIDGSPAIAKPLWPRPDLDSRRGSDTSTSPILKTWKLSPTSSTRPWDSSSDFNRSAGIPKTSRSMSLTTLFPGSIRRSRTQPPTTSARPPASFTASAMARARSKESDTGFAAESLDDLVGEARRDRIEHDEAARREVRIDLGDRLLDRARDRLRDLFHRLLRPERAGHGGAGLALHDLGELRRRRDGTEDADVDVRPVHFGAKALGHPDLRELRRGVRAHIGHAALAGDRRHDDDVAALLAAEDGQRRPRRVVGAEVVDVHQLPHLLRRDVVDGAVDAEAGVAHHHVEPAERLDRLVDEHLHV